MRQGFVEASAVLAEEYVDNFDQETFNGIYTFPQGTSSLIFGTGGVAIVLDQFSFITTRNYSGSTILALDYRLEGGSWVNALTTTSGAVIGALNCTSGNNLCYGKTATMSFGGVLADEWRWSRLSGDQVSLHEVAVYGTIADVTPIPVPAALPLFGTGLGLMALIGWIRRRRGSGVAEA